MLAGKLSPKEVKYIQEKNIKWIISEQKKKSKNESQTHTITTKAKKKNPQQHEYSRNQPSLIALFSPFTICRQK